MRVLLWNWLMVSLTVTVVGGLLLLFRPLLRKHYTARRLCVVWLVLALRLLIPLQPLSIELPFLTSSLQTQAVQPILPQDGVSTPSQPSTPLPDVAPERPSIAPDTSQPVEPVTPPPSVPIEPQPEPPAELQPTLFAHLAALPWDRIALWAWLGGAVLTLCVLLVPALRLSGAIRRSAKGVLDEAICARLDEARRLTGYRGSVRLMTCRGIPSPLVYGLFRPVLLLPDTQYPHATMDMSIMVTRISDNALFIMFVSFSNMFVFIYSPKAANLI